MSQLSVSLRGIRHRRVQSLIVILLGTIATAAAVVIPAYTRAAQQSVLTDTVAEVWPATAGIEVGVASGSPGMPDLARATASVDAALADTTIGGLLAPPIGTMSHDRTEVLPANTRTLSEMVYRTGVCDHLVIEAGACPRRPGEAIVSSRSAATAGWALNQRLTLQRPEIPPSLLGPARWPAPITVTVTGVYRVVDEQSTFWGNTLFFPDGKPLYADKVADTYDVADAVFVGVESDLSVDEPAPKLLLEYHYTGHEIRLDQVPAIAADIAALNREISFGTFTTGLPTSVELAAEHQDALAASVPLVAVPLVLLCWFVLFLVCAALTEERGPEIALGKLRGLRLSRIAMFAATEPLLLIALATPLGLALGVGLTEAGARAFLAEGGRVELRWPVLLVAVVAFAGAAVAAALATRRTVRASVLSLLRRVPARRQWRAVAVESAVGALALAGLYQVLAGGDRDSPIGYLAPPLLALVAGLLAARLLSGWARLRNRTAAASGDLAKLLSTAQLARRPATARVVVLLTVAVGMLTFAVTIWDVGAVNREVAARAAVGAPRVHVVKDTDPTTLMAAVRAADPGGRQAMAVAWSVQPYGGADVRFAAVDATRLTAVANWPDRTDAEVATVADRLAPRPTAPISVRGPVVEADVDVRQLVQNQPMSLVLVVARDNAPRQVQLGALRPGRHTYQGRLDDCPDGCRLIGIAVRHYPADFTESSVDLTVGALRDAGRPLDGRFGDDGAWRAPIELAAGQRLTVRPGTDGVRLTGSTAQFDLVAEYDDYPGRVPVALGGGLPTMGPTADEFAFMTIGAKLTQMQVVDRSLALPGVGRPAVLFDLSTAQRDAERGGPGNLAGWRYEVWTTPDAGPELLAALSEAGVVFTGVEDAGDRSATLGRLAPALALRLYLLAGMVAALLGVGVLLLGARVAAPDRLREMAALRLVGVPAVTLRRALRREYGMIIAVPLVMGLAAGLGGAALLLPAIPLVTFGPDALDPVYRLGSWWLPGAVAVLTAGLLLATATVLRTVGRADPRLLREGVG
ncbi:FtsX-like permease family protein [Polymorphospora rubra]|uniref:FtsX-like permease family protein n=1 Tax=Polymorphospora rubra TaxID=338584 RepID=UPI0033CE5E55